MISSGSKDQADFTTKQEGSTSDNNISKHINPSTSTSSWSRLKDPRIVRVSRAFGGKDRHSKVYTVRGLRDRRVRLSVPTAIQLYDLQERLGLNQPSKVVDWLLNAAKNEIDQLPPLQIPPGSFGQTLESPPDRLKGLKMSNWDEPLQLSRSTPSSSLPSALLNNVVPHINPFLRWDPSSLSLSSQFGTPHHQSEDVQDVQSLSLSSQFGTPHHQSEDVHDRFSVMPMPNHNLSGSHQFLEYPPQTQPYFPSNVSNASGEINFQMLGSSTSTNSLASPIYSISQGMRPNFHLSMNPNFFPSQNNSDNETNKDS